MAGPLADDATPDQKAEHEKLLGRLKRLNSPGDAAKALREQDKLISSGQLKRALPKDAKPDQVAAWRTENGIPETPDKYDLGVPADIELNPYDKKMLAGVAAKMHAANASPEVVKAGVAAYFETRAAVAAAMEEANATAKSVTVETLRSEWGGDYKTNLDGVNSMLKNSDSQAVAGILAARTPDGVQLLNNPEVMRWLAGHARELGYVGATVVPAGGDLGKTIDDELTGIKALMGDPDSTYWKGPAAEKTQARYRELLDAQARRNKK
jgi:hypothetical protein